MIDDKIDNMLLPYKETIGSHFLHYKNHVHRVVNFSLSLKNKFVDDDDIKIAIATVFHDIGMWTANTFDYLNPSIEEALNYLRKENKEEWSQEISLIIEMHHKRTAYNGKFADNVEAFRKADLIDLTKGLKKFGLSKQLIEKNYAKYPMGDFRKIITLKFVNNLFKNPLNPLPMFKK